MSPRARETMSFSGVFEHMFLQINRQTRAKAAGELSRHHRLTEGRRMNVYVFETAHLWPQA